MLYRYHRVIDKIRLVRHNPISNKGNTIASWSWVPIVTFFKWMSRVFDETLRVEPTKNSPDVFSSPLKVFSALFKQINEWKKYIPKTDFTPSPYAQLPFRRDPRSAYASFPQWDAVTFYAAKYVVPKPRILQLGWKILDKLTSTSQTP